MFARVAGTSNSSHSVTERFGGKSRLPMMNDKRAMLNHFLAALAYRTQKALRDAPADFGSFKPPNNIRAPKELVRHMTSVLGYARTYFIGGSYWPDPLES